MSLNQKGALALVAGADLSNTECLPVLAPDHPDADAICLIQSFYCCLTTLAMLRGRVSDQPRHLQKVTRTR
jgi:glucosamine--fructose-6-phosphate aminotransferase (isomerizing)